jgi:hypothetical protein
VRAAHARCDALVDLVRKDRAESTHCPHRSAKQCWDAATACPITAAAVAIASPAAIAVLETDFIVPLFDAFMRRAIPVEG